MSGVSHIYLVPREKVSAINWVLPTTPTSFDEMVTLEALTGESATTAVALSGTNTKFMKVEFKRGSAELNYSVQGEKGCHSLNAVLSIARNGFKKAPLGFFTYALNESFVMIAVLENGESHLLGDMNHGMEMDDSNNSATSGAANTDPNTVNFSFEWATNFPMIFGSDFDADKGTGINGIVKAE